MEEARRVRRGLEKLVARTQAELDETKTVLAEKNAEIARLKALLETK